MRNVLTIFSLSSFSLLTSCAPTRPAVPSETLQIRMNDQWAEVLNVDSLTDMAPQDSLAPEIEPKPILMVQPDYPFSSLESTQRGLVYVKAWVTSSGNVKKAYIISSTSTNFNRAVLKATVMWKFRPAMVNGEPVAVWVIIPFRFKMK